VIKNLLQEILDWSEVWAPLIPLLILSFSGKQPRYAFPVIVYLWVAFVIDALIDVGWKFGNCAPSWMNPNNYLYNVHSIGRFLFFAAFFYLLSPLFRATLDKLIIVAATVAMVVNFTYFENFYEVDNISSRLFAFEAGLLLFYCIRYYWMKTKTVEERGPDFWIVTGLSVYVVFNFFYFLFYTTLITNGYISFVIAMWNFHNLTYIILCIFIARAFYVVSDH
jgi:hypothetical protein